MSDRCVPLHRCIAAAGELLSGHFLHRLLRWHRYTKVRRDGHKWVTLTRAQWQVELDCSLKQLRRVLATMEARGFIVRGQHGFAGKVSLFARPTEALQRAVLDEQGPTRAGPPGPTWASPAGPTLQTFRIKPIEETKIASGRPAAAALAPTPALTPTPPQKPTSTPASTATQVAALEALWRDARPQAPITQKMRGQFRHLVRTLGAGEAERAVRFALAHWARLVRAAERHHGAFKSPDTPQLGFLVKHIEAARGLLENRSHKQPHPEEPHVVRRLEGPVLSDAEGWASDMVRFPTLRDATLRVSPQGEGFVGRLRSPIMTYKEMLALEASP